MNFVLRLQAFYENYFASNATAYTEWAVLYGWLAASSLVVALTTLFFVFFRREQARAFAGLIGQHVLILGVPWFIEPVMNLMGSWL